MSKATERLNQFLTAISAMEIENVQAMFADNVTQFVPFAPEGTPDNIIGKEAVSATFASLPMMFKSMNYTNIELVETKDEHFAIGFADANATLVNDKPYHQRYVFYVRINEAGLITEYREYMNPIALREAIAQLSEN